MSPPIEANLKLFHFTVHVLVTHQLRFQTALPRSRMFLMEQLNTQLNLILKHQ